MAIELKRLKKDVDNFDESMNGMMSVLGQLVLTRVMSTESGSFASARTIVQLYLDNKDLGQVLHHEHCDRDGVADDDVSNCYRDKNERGFLGANFSLSPCSFRLNSLVRHSFSSDNIHSGDATVGGSTGSATAASGGGKGHHLLGADCCNLQSCHIGARL